MEALVHAWSRRAGVRGQQIFSREPNVQSVSVCWKELCHVRCGMKKASFSSN